MPLSALTAEEAGNNYSSYTEAKLCEYLLLSYCFCLCSTSGVSVSHLPVLVHFVCSQYGDALSNIGQRDNAQIVH